MNKIEFRKLLSFYLDCIEEEDLRSLSFNASQLNKSFVMGANGDIVLTNKQFSITSTAELSFWSNRDFNSGESETLYLGYPILIHEQKVSPLFFLEVSVKHLKENTFSINVTDNACLLNHHLFGKKILESEGSSKLQDELETELSLLSSSISKAFNFLDGEFDKNRISSPEEVATVTGKDTFWASNFILFRGGRSATNAMLKRDIDNFLKYPSLIDNIEGTALEAFLTYKSSDNVANIISTGQFSELNVDQEQAIQKSLTQKLTVITGPPGTGKSQVVTNILAHCALHKRSVLFASKNNKAVDVVYDKLQSILENENWLLRLGNNEKIEQCEARIMQQLGSSQEPSYPTVRLNENILSTELNIAKITHLKSQVQKFQDLLSITEKDIMFSENILGVYLMDQITEKVSWDDSDYMAQKVINDRYTQLLGLVGIKSAPLWLKCISVLFSTRLKTKYKKFLNLSSIGYLKDPLVILQDININASFFSLCDGYKKLSQILHLKRLYYERDQIEKALLKLPASLELKRQETEEIEKKVHLYQQKLRSTWGLRIQEKRASLFALFRRYFSAIQNHPINYVGWKKFGDDLLSLLPYFPVWIVTNLSTRKSIPLQAKVFDLVIIDEASQCDILSALPLLYRARNAIIIGDPKQLKHISLISSKKENEIAQRHNVQNFLSNWSYRNKSIYDLAESTLLDSGQQPELLSFHYRCHPDIIGFSNTALYNCKLQPQTNIQLLQDKFNDIELGVFWHDVKGSVPTSSNSAYNQFEIDRIIELLDEWRPKLEMQKLSIGIVTPFRKQVDKVFAAINSKKDVWGEAFISSIRIGTAHRFQGDECDLIILSPVVANGLKSHLAKWVASTDELLNVAVTRARGALHIVGDMESCLMAGHFLEALVLYTKNKKDVGNQNAFESPAEEIIGGILSSLGLTYYSQVEKGPYRLDFILTTPFGSKFNLEVDGRQHYTAEHIEKDEIRDIYVGKLGYKVIRLSAKDTFKRPESLKKRLSQLV